MAAEDVICKACKFGPCILGTIALTGLPKDSKTPVLGTTPISGGNTVDVAEYCNAHYRKP